MTEKQRPRIISRKDRIWGRAFQSSEHDWKKHDEEVSKFNFEHLNM